MVPAEVVDAEDEQDRARRLVRGRPCREPELGQVRCGARASRPIRHARPDRRLAEQVQRLGPGVEEVRQHDRRLHRDPGWLPGGERDEHEQESQTDAPQ